MAGLDERFVRAFVADGSGLARQDVHPAQDQAPAPRRLFATVLLIDDAPYGGLIIGSDRKDGDERAYVHHRRALYSVQFFRKGAVAAAHRFSSWAETDGGLLAAEGGTRDVPPRGEDPAWPNGIQVRLDFPIAVRRIDEIVKDGFEERAGSRAGDALRGHLHRARHRRGLRAADRGDRDGKPGRRDHHKELIRG